MLESEGVGFGEGDEKVTVLAYADDLVFLSDSWNGMSKNLAILAAYCNLTGLKVNTSKCHSFMIAGGKRKANRINNCPLWTMGGEALHIVGPEETVDYLGASVNPWLGPRPADITQAIKTFGFEIAKAKLKPSQRR